MWFNSIELSKQVLTVIGHRRGVTTVQPWSNNDPKLSRTDAEKGAGPVYGHFCKPNRNLKGLTATNRVITGLQGALRGR